MDFLTDLKEPISICRLCSANDPRLYPVFCFNDVETKAISLAMKITLCTTVKISKNDSFPKKICYTCYNFIKDWYHFRLKCIKSAETFLKADIQPICSVLEGNLELPGNSHGDKVDSSGDEAISNDVAIDLNSACTDFQSNRKSPEAKFACEQCPAYFSLFNELSLHKLTRHCRPLDKTNAKPLKPVQNISIQDSKKKKCTREKFNMVCCDVSYISIARYRQHRQAKHPSEKPYACDICGKRNFISYQTLKRHKVLHTGRFACKECGKSFTCHAILRIHVRDKHENDRPFICDYCGKGFVTELLLSYHQRFHRGERKFVCEECGVAVVTSSSLAKHKRLHSNVRPHVCQVCNKGFVVKGRLVEHMRKHTGERPFVCEICKKSFTMRDKLKRHVRTHLKQTLYSCQKCLMGYSTCKGLTNHLRTHSPS